MDKQVNYFDLKNSSITDKIVNPYYTAIKCPWHYHHTCLVITTNHNNRRFHCLYDYKDSRTRYKYYNSTKSCDIPEHFYDLILLNESLGSDYVLPFVNHFRIISGETIGLFEIEKYAYGTNIIKSHCLAETFLTFVTLFCATCYQLGGSAPELNDMKFIYTEKHPVLVDIHLKNALTRERHFLQERLNEKKWKRFLTTRTPKEIIHYLKITHSTYFKKKKKKCSDCILIEDVNFSDITHELLCKNGKNSLYDILKKYKNLITSLTGNIQNIIDSITEN